MGAEVDFTPEPPQADPAAYYEDCIERIGDLAKGCPVNDLRHAG